jgi:hypothetical protein
LLLVSFAPASRGQGNPNVTLPMHAVLALSPGCNIPGGGHGGPDPCNPGPPRVQIPDPSPEVTVYLMVRNYADVTAVQTTLAWDDTWSFIDSNPCGVQSLTQMPTCDEGRTMSVLATFDAITGGVTKVIARLEFDVTGPGCLTQQESPFPLGTVVVSSGEVVSPVLPARRGSICAGSMGVNACNP